MKWMSKIQSGHLHSELFGRRHSTLQSHAARSLCISWALAVYSCVCFGDADAVLLLTMLYSSFFLSSYFTFPPKFVLASLWKRAWLMCKMVLICGRLLFGKPHLLYFISRNDHQYAIPASNSCYHRPIYSSASASPWCCDVTGNMFADCCCAADDVCFWSGNPCFSNTGMRGFFSLETLESTLCPEKSNPVCTFL